MNESCDMLVSSQFKCVRERGERDREEREDFKTDKKTEKEEEKKKMNEKE